MKIISDEFMLYEKSWLQVAGHASFIRADDLRVDIHSPMLAWLTSIHVFLSKAYSGIR